MKFLSLSPEEALAANERAYLIAQLVALAGLVLVVCLKLFRRSAHRIKWRVAAGVGLVFGVLGLVLAHSFAVVSLWAAFDRVSGFACHLSGYETQLLALTSITVEVLVFRNLSRHAPAA